MVTPQLVEERLGLPLLVLQGVQELEQVVVADRVVRGSRGTPQQMEHHRLPDLGLWTGEVADAVAFLVSKVTGAPSHRRHKAGL